MTGITPFAIPLAECARQPRARVGGKAHGLGLLLRAGLPVPAGVCLPAEVFRLVRDRTAVGDAIRAQLALLGAQPVYTGKALQSIREQILRVPLPPDLDQRLRMEVRHWLKKGPLAVRSSCATEDLQSSSSAGIYWSETGLLECEEAILAIRKCWASLFTERARFYTRAEPALDMAVILQQSVQGDLTGVMFTADPLTGERTRLVEYSGREPVTDGADSAGRLVLEPGEEALPSALVAALLAVAEKVETVLSAPADIEWLWAGGRLFVLQARPITTGPRPLPSGARWASQEDTSAVAQLALGRCERLFMRALQKKVWFRQLCRSQGIPIFEILYLVYDGASLPGVMPEIVSRLNTRCVQLHWGDRSLVVTRDRLAEALMANGPYNPVGNGFSCVELGEMIEATETGFSARLATGEVLVEAYPNGLRGLKSGALRPSRYLLGPRGEVLEEHPATFRARAHLHLPDGRWKEEERPEYLLALSPGVRERIANLTIVLAERLGEVRVEWYAHEDTVFVKDLSLESSPMARATGQLVLSLGACVGRVVRVGPIEEFDRLAHAREISVVSHSLAEVDARHVPAVQRVAAMAARGEALIGLADYPSVGLIPLLPYLSGFVFSRGTMLCHTAIVLRERHLPAVIVEDADLLEEGDTIALTPEGVTVLEHGSGR